VYFERVRDEVRDGRNLGAAVEAAWLRARRTILASDSVSFLAAAVLYLLAVGGVRGFAFTLGLTTLVDVVVVFLFTKPVVTLLARTRFFGGGHRLSGFDPAHLGRTVSYAGRGRVRTPKPERRPEPAVAAARSTGPSIAERKAAERGGGESIAEPGAAERGGGQSIAERKAAAQKAADEAVASGQEPAAGLAAQRPQDREQDTVTPRGRKS
jgi:preprotein translocase subunit SecD